MGFQSNMFVEKVDLFEFRPHKPNPNASPPEYESARTFLELYFNEGKRWVRIGAGNWSIRKPESWELTYLHGQFQLNDGSYLLVVDECDARVWPGLPIGRPVFRNGRIQIWIIAPNEDEETNWKERNKYIKKSEREIEVRKINWMWDTSDPTYHIVGETSVRHVRLVSPREISITLVDGKDYRVRLFKKMAPKLISFHAAGIFGFLDYEVGTKGEIPYFIWRCPNFSWYGWAAFGNRVLDFTIGNAWRILRRLILNNV